MAKTDDDDRVKRPKSRTFDFAGICDATNIHNFRGHEWLGFNAFHRSA